MTLKALRENKSFIDAAELLKLSQTKQLMGITSGPGDGGLFRLRNVIIVGYFCYLILLKLLHVLVVRPSSSRDILARITRLTMDPLFL
jgi:hypothetical protein